jgi:hypothetical protein
MVGLQWAALGVAAMLHSGPAVEEALDPVGKLADAIALSRTCPSLQLDKETIARTLARAGISIAPLVPIIAERSRSMAMRYVLMDYQEACSLARERYGKTGTAAAGFLAER